MSYCKWQTLSGVGSNGGYIGGVQTARVTMPKMPVARVMTYSAPEPTLPQGPRINYGMMHGLRGTTEGSWLPIVGAAGIALCIGALFSVLIPD